jgi:uncharacterized protein
VRVEVGYGLEPVLTDALTRLILHDQVLPHLRSNDIPGAMEAGTDALVQQLGLDPAQARQRVQQAAVERPARRERGNPLLGILIAVVIFVVFILIAQRAARRRRYGYGGYDGYDRGPGIWPFFFLGGMGGWGGGGGDSSDSGGGGNDDFGGGDGGSFGGGGSSDSY